jgi:hypothetical protein
MSSLALITGASAGIGAEFARQLADRQCDLILVARRLDKLDGLARELRSAKGIRVETLAADLASDEGIRAVAEKIRATPELDYLINNAGFGTRGVFHQTDAGPQEQMHRLHVLATVALTHAALPAMVRRSRGNIINVASVAGFVMSAGSVSYNATKHWMNVFTEGLYLELEMAGSPVRVQALCPGYTYSEFHDVAGVSRSTVPASLWLNAGFVVRESLAGLEHNRLFVIPDWRYRGFVAVTRYFPRWLRHRLAIAAGRRMKRI